MYVEMCVASTYAVCEIRKISVKPVSVIQNPYFIRIRVEGIFSAESPYMDHMDHTFLVESPYMDHTDQIFFVKPHIWPLSQSICGYFVNRGNAFVFLVFRVHPLSTGGLY